MSSSKFIVGIRAQLRRVDVLAGLPNPRASTEVTTICEGLVFRGDVAQLLEDEERLREMVEDAHVALDDRQVPRRHPADGALLSLGGRIREWRSLQRAADRSLLREEVVSAAQRVANSTAPHSAPLGYIESTNLLRGALARLHNARNR